MIRHCALFRFQADASEEEIAELLQGFVELQDQIKDMLEVLVGSNMSSEGLSQGFDHGIIIDFPDKAAVEHYLAHPDHLALAERVVPRLEGGLNGALPFDLEVRGASTG